MDDSHKTSISQPNSFYFKIVAHTLVKSNPNWQLNLVSLWPVALKFLETVLLIGDVKVIQCLKKGFCGYTLWNLKTCATNFEFFYFI